MTQCTDSIPFENHMLKFDFSKKSRIKRIFQTQSMFNSFTFQDKIKINLSIITLIISTTNSTYYVINHYTRTWIFKKLKGN